MHLQVVANLPTLGTGARVGVHIRGELHMLRMLGTAAGAAILGIAAAASAADLSGGSKLETGDYIAPSAWTGFYVAAGIGGAAINRDVKLNTGGGTLLGIDRFGGEGVFGTIQAGYDRQLGAKFVGGIFADYDYTDIRSNFTISNLTLSFDLKDMWSVGGRAGYLVNSNTLLYFLAAYSGADINVPAGLTIKPFTGYSAGAGLETQLSGNWFVKGEYRFTQLNEQTALSGGSEMLTTQPDLQTGRLSLAYKFGQLYQPMK